MKMISFRTERILGKILNYEFISVATIMEIFDKDEYLPHNRSDAYNELKILVEGKFVKKIKQGLYKPNIPQIQKALGELK